MKPEAAAVRPPMYRMYRWWPRWSPGGPELGGAGLIGILSTGVGLLALTAMLCVPVVARTFGLPPRVTVCVMAAYYACMWGNDYVLLPLALKSRRGFNAQLIIVPLYNVAFLTALLLIPNEPRSPLWMGLLLYTGTTASWQEVDKSYAFLLFHTVAPLLCIPVFLHRGAPFGWSITGPVLCSLLSGIGYHLISISTSYWRSVRAEQAATIARLRAEAQQRERERIAQDLHDSVGSVLGIVALSCDLVERSANDASQVRAVVASLREASRAGLGELRGVLDAMAPARGDLETLVQNLRRTGKRSAEAAGATISVQLEAPGTRTVDGAVRLALVRVYQEAVGNSLRHGKATQVDAVLDAPSDDEVRLVVEDNGESLAPAYAREGGRGVAGMRKRAEELGGRFTIGPRGSSTDGKPGTRIELCLPRG